MKVLRWLAVVAAVVVIAGGAGLGLLYGPTVDYEGPFGAASDECAPPFLFWESAPSDAKIAELNEGFAGLGDGVADEHRACTDAVGPLRIAAAGLLGLGVALLVASIVMAVRRRRSRPGSTAPVGPQIGVPPPPQRSPVAPSR